MARPTKQRRRPTTTTSPRVSPPDKDTKRSRTNTITNFLVLATSDNDSEATPKESNISGPHLTTEESVEPPTSDMLNSLDSDSQDESNRSTMPSSTTPTLFQQEASSGITADEASDQTLPTGTATTMSTETGEGQVSERSFPLDQRQSQLDDQSSEATNDHWSGLPRRTEPNLQTEFRLIPARPVTLRYSLRLYLAQTNPTDNDLIDALRKFGTQLRSIDSTAIIYPWADSINPLPPITSTATLPTSVQRLRQYFPRLSHRSKDGNVHTTIRLGTSLPQATIRDRFSPWLQQHRFGLWPCQLQSETTKCLGWFLYSVREMDLSALTEAIFQHTQFQVGLRWRPIATGKQLITNGRDKVRAVHMEVSAADYEAASTCFRQMYSAAASGPFPNGVRLRLVPELGPHMSVPLRTKVERLCNRQAQFVHATVKVATWEIEALDFRDKHTGESLRDQLLRIKSTTHPNVNLFHSVDRFWNGNGHVITILPLVEDEARSIIAGLLPYLRATIASAFVPDRYFTASAIERANLVTWDVSNHGLITADDQFIQAILAEDEGFEFGGATFSEKDSHTENALAQLPQGPNLLDGENDSVSTLQSVRKSMKTTGLPILGRNQPHASLPSTRNASPPNSTVSSITIEERVVNMEKQFASSLASVFVKLSELNDKIEAPRHPPMAGHLRGQVETADIPRDVGPSP